MRSDKIVWRRKSHGWLFVTISGFHIPIDVFVVVW